MEKKLHAALHRLVPLLAIRNPLDLIVDSLIPRLSAADEDWEDEVGRLAEEASFVVVDCFALAPGVATELELLRRCGRADETVVVLSDPAAPVPLGLVLLEALESQGLELPNNQEPSKDHPALLGFSRVANESEIDWAHLETSNLFRDLIRATQRQEAGDLSHLRLADRVRLLREQAKQLRESGDQEVAGATAEEALALAEELGDPKLLAAAHVTLGTTALDRDDLYVALGLVLKRGQNLQPTWG